jgi:formate dehydrogenase maturation protein FdhE
MSRQSRLGQLEKAMPCPVCANAPQSISEPVRFIHVGEEESPEAAAVADCDEVITCPACGKARVRSQPRVVFICHELPDLQPTSTTPGTEGAQ